MLIRALIVAALLLTAPIAEAQTPHWLLDAAADQRVMGSSYQTHLIDIYNHDHSAATLTIETLTCGCVIGCPYLGYLWRGTGVTFTDYGQYLWTSKTSAQAHASFRGLPVSPAVPSFPWQGDIWLSTGETTVKNLGIILLPGQSLTLVAAPSVQLWCRVQGSMKPIAP